MRMPRPRKLSATNSVRIIVNCTKNEFLTLLVLKAKPCYALERESNDEQTS